MAGGLVGRAPELERLVGLLDEAPTRGGATLVRGPAGVGKTALLGQLGAAATERGMLVLSTAGVEAEAWLPFAGLQRMLQPVASGIPDLPPPQRETISAALGIVHSDSPPDLYLTALATLGLIGEVASPERPLLILIDDAHWLDRSSADVFAFVARRLELEPAVMVAAARTGFVTALDSGEIGEFELGPLDAPSSQVLLASVAPELGSAIRKRVLVEAEGNPLALVELPAGLRASGAEAFPAWLPLTTRLERSFAARYSDLAPTTQCLLLVAALNDGAAVGETVAATTLLTDDATADHLAPAVEARLVEVTDQRIRFVHPLIRSAIRQAATIGERQAAHAALAEVLDTERDRAVWHRASASPTADDAIATELEAAAARASQRGAIDIAVATLVRAAELSSESTLQVRRLLEAAELAVQQGKRDVVLALLGRAERFDLTRRQQWWMVWIRESFDDGIRDVAAGAWSLAELAEEAADDGELDLALNLLWGAALRCFWSEPGEETRQRVVAATDHVAKNPFDPRVLAILAYAAPLARGEAVMTGLQYFLEHPIEDPRATYMLSTAANLVGASPLAASFGSAALARLRSQGRLGVLVRVLALRAWSSVHLADLEVAGPGAAEAARLAKETEQPIMLATARVTEAMCAALRGEEDAVIRIVAEAEQASLGVGARPVLASIQMARGLLALGRGRYGDAYVVLRRIYDPTDPTFHIALRCFAIGDLVEAAVYGGRRDDVLGVVAEMEQLAAITPSPALHAGLRYARALIADTEELFLAALGKESLDWPFHHARTLLAYGGWLRRQRRTAESRDPLRRAQEIFDALGTTPWGERARQELRASGETARQRVPAAREQLTPQELQIAGMAADGLTNREIGERLYLSHRTVSSHLHRIFPKLSISSRLELRDALEFSA